LIAFVAVELATGHVAVSSTAVLALQCNYRRTNVAPASQACIDCHRLADQATVQSVSQVLSSFRYTV
jgi:hypothetical protein